MKFQFYIFGVPEGFDLYPADADKIQYFQRYYDGSSENEKLSILRRGNTISYSYLRYNHIGSRTGSFFGMSLLFAGQYCTDVSKLYKLFDELYSAILKQGVLLKKTESGHPQFGVAALKNAANVIDAVKGNIQAIIDSQFAFDFKPLDSSFRQGENLDKVMQLNDKAGNAAFLAALKEFPMISISPIFSGGIVKKIPQEKIDALVAFSKKVEQESNVLEGESKIIANSFSALSLTFSEDEKKRKLQQIAPQYNNVVGSIDELLGKCNTMLRMVAEYQKVEPNLRILAETAQHAVVQKTKLDNEKQALFPFASAILQVDNSTYTSGTIHGPGTGANTTDKTSPIVINGGGQKSPVNPIPARKSIFNDKNTLTILVVVSVVVALLAFAAYFAVPRINPAKNTDKIGSTDNGPTSPNNTEKLIAEGKTSLEKKDFNNAIEKFEKAGRTDLSEDAKIKAQRYYEDEGLNYARVGEWQNAILAFNKAKKIGSQAVLIDSEIEKCQTEINKAKTRGESQQSNHTTSANVAININLHPIKQVYSVRDTLRATAKSGSTIHQGGQWKFEDGLYANQDKNPTTVEITSVPNKGTAILSYYINNKKVKEVTIKITP
jgi:tetratricopeptide (TPR) repeat protein